MWEIVLATWFPRSIVQRIIGASSSGVARQSDPEIRDNQNDGWPKASATNSCIDLRSSYLSKPE
jgi:hypothetical protein